MAHIIYSRIGIRGEGKLNPAYEYISHIKEDIVDEIDRTKHNVEVNEGEICLDKNNPVEKDAIYCTSGYVSTKDSGSLHCWNSGSFYYNKIVFDKDLFDLDTILANGNVSEEQRDSFLRLVFIGYFAAFDRYVIDAYTFFGFWKYNSEKQNFEFNNEVELKGVRKERPQKGDFLKFFSGLNVPICGAIKDSLDEVETFRSKRNSMVHFNGTRKEDPYRYEEISEDELSKLRGVIVHFAETFDAEMKQYAELINPFESIVLR